MPLRENIFGTGTQDPIVKFYNKLRRYPGNNKQWWVTKAQSDGDNGVKQGDFQPEQLDKFYSGNNRAPRGHFILNEFYKDRSSTAGVGSIPPVVTKERPITCAFFSGRVWFGLKSTVYFSQVMTERYKAGQCYQEADPTSEDISELIATDGGVIPIPEAQRIVKIVPDGDGILIFATNGVWSIAGTSNGFSAEDITCTKVSHVGCQNPWTIVPTAAGVFWWSEIGILAITQKFGAYGPVLGVFDSNNVSETTIQEFYNNISEDAKQEAKGVYDTLVNRISWLYRDTDVGVNQFNRVLHFDIALKAFYPWKISNLATSPFYVKGFYRSERIDNTIADDLIVVGGVQVQAGGVDVENIVNVPTKGPRTIEYLSMRGTEGRFCQVNSSKYVDWFTANGAGATYESYVETGYDLFEDGMRRKRITYILPYLRRTETAWTDASGVEVLTNPSSCTMTVKWDWADSTGSNKWSTPVQVYRNSQYLNQPLGAIDSGFPMVISKNKVRGNGRAIQFRFGTSEAGHNFDLYGWSLALTGNTVP